MENELKDVKILFAFKRDILAMDIGTQLHQQGAVIITPNPDDWSVDNIESCFRMLKEKEVDLVIMDQFMLTPDFAKKVSEYAKVLVVCS